MSLAIVALRGSVSSTWTLDFKTSIGKYSGFSLDQRGQLEDIFKVVDPVDLVGSVDLLIWLVRLGRARVGLPAGCTASWPGIGVWMVGVWGRRAPGFHSCASWLAASSLLTPLEQLPHRAPLPRPMWAPSRPHPAPTPPSVVQRPPPPAPQELSDTSGSNKRSAGLADVATLGDSWLAAAVQRRLVQPIPGAERYRWFRMLPPRLRALVRRDAQGRQDPRGDVYGAPYRWRGQQAQGRAGVRCGRRRVACTGPWLGCKLQQAAAVGGWTKSALGPARRWTTRARAGVAPLQHVLPEARANTRCRPWWCARARGARASGSLSFEQQLLGERGSSKAWATPRWPPAMQWRRNNSRGAHAPAALTPPHPALWLEAVCVHPHLHLYCRWGCTLVAYRKDRLLRRGGRPILDWADLLQVGWAVGQGGHRGTGGWAFPVSGAARAPDQRVSSSSGFAIACNCT